MAASYGAGGSASTLARPGSAVKIARWSRFHGARLVALFEQKVRHLEPAAASTAPSPGAPVGSGLGCAPGPVREEATEEGEAAPVEAPAVVAPPAQDEVGPRSSLGLRLAVVGFHGDVQSLVSSRARSTRCTDGCTVAACRGPVEWRTGRE